MREERGRQKHPCDLRLRVWSAVAPFWLRVAHARWEGMCKGTGKDAAHRGDDARGVERLIVLLHLSEVLAQPVEHETVGLPQLVKRHLLVRRKGRYEEELCEGVCEEVLMEVGGGWMGRRRGRWVRARRGWVR